MTGKPRVALFADSFHEVNGAALTCRQLEAFAGRRGYPFLSVQCGPEPILRKTDPLWTLQLCRGRLAFSIERDLSVDPLLFLRRAEILSVVKEFQPDIVHVASPGDIGLLGAWAAHALRIPWVASWHTNLHEFAARRMERLCEWLPKRPRAAIANLTERWVLKRVLWFYGLARATLAPNTELQQMLNTHSDRPSFLMRRGIDTALFSPSRRDRESGPFTLGFVGRLTPEKNVRFLAKVEQALLAADAPPFRFLVIGAGSEKPWLMDHLRNAAFPGVLAGEELARNYANMDLFLFPSHTDTFGNVALEAMASGVPVVVTADGGPKYLVRNGVTGFIAGTAGEFVESVLRIMRDAALLGRMRQAAREHVRNYSWNKVFEEEVYAAYRICLGNPHADAWSAVADANARTARRSRITSSAMTSTARNDWNDLSEI